MHGLSRSRDAVPCNVVRDEMEMGSTSVPAPLDVLQEDMRQHMEDVVVRARRARNERIYQQMYLRHLRRLEQKHRRRDLPYRRVKHVYERNLATERKREANRFRLYPGEALNVMVRQAFVDGFSKQTNSPYFQRYQDWIQVRREETILRWDFIVPSLPAATTTAAPQGNFSIPSLPINLEEIFSDDIEGFDLMETEQLDIQGLAFDVACDDLAIAGSQSDCDPMEWGKSLSLGFGEEFDTLVAQAFGLLGPKIRFNTKPKEFECDNDNELYEYEYTDDYDSGLSDQEDGDECCGERRHAVTVAKSRCGATRGFPDTDLPSLKKAKAVVESSKLLLQPKAAQYDVS